MSNIFLGWNLVYGMLVVQSLDCFWVVHEMDTKWFYILFGVVKNQSWIWNMSNIFLGCNG